MTNMARYEEVHIHLLHICFWLKPEWYLWRILKIESKFLLDPTADMQWGLLYDSMLDLRADSAEAEEVKESPNGRVKFAEKQRRRLI